ncbi:hypothetical protein QP968_06790 [Corynebacterium sp. MSK041]|uniref:hypothetical protein n=1 Tax=Corynebacterium sp. MSK041 TaxID=3050194 RepID=UPI00254B3169|nr:hypothetical protein [Corynebacterium sp. MSK041]MDK8795419.1 hypothetical protein [Corynebacterium sp. MSK041]
MKIRKSLLAAATAAVVSVSGVVAAPAFAEENAGTNQTAGTNQPGGDTPSKDENKGSGQGSSNKDESENENEKSSASDFMKELFYNEKGQLDPKLITAWIAVFTAILGLIANVITFAQKNFK